MYPQLAAGLDIVADHCFALAALLLRDRQLADHGERPPAQPHGVAPQLARRVRFPIGFQFDSPHDCPSLATEKAGKVGRGGAGGFGGDRDFDCLFGSRAVGEIGVKLLFGGGGPAPGENGDHVAVVGVDPDRGRQANRGRDENRSHCVAQTRWQSRQQHEPGDQQDAGGNRSEHQDQAATAGKTQVRPQPDQQPERPGHAGDPQGGPPVNGWLGRCRRTGTHFRRGVGIRHDSIHVCDWVAAAGLVRAGSSLLAF